MRCELCVTVEAFHTYIKVVTICPFLNFSDVALAIKLILYGLLHLGQALLNFFHVVVGISSYSGELKFSGSYTACDSFSPIVI